MPGQPRAGRPSPCICFQRRGLSEHQTFFGSPLYIYNTDLIYRTKSAPLILLIPRGNLRVGAGDKPTPRSARKRTWGRVVRAKSRASVASRVIRVQSPTASAWAGTSQEPPTQTQLGRAKNSNAFFSVTPPVGGNSMSNNRPIGALSLAGKNLRSVKPSSRACRISPRVASLGSSARPVPRAPPRSAQSPESPARLASPARPSRPLYSWGCPRVLIKASHRHTALPSRRCAARQQ